VSWCEAKAYNWNNLKEKRVINDRAAKDQGCFFDFEKTSPSVITMQNDTLFYDNQPYKTDGSGIKHPYFFKTYCCLPEVLALVEKHFIPTQNEKYFFCSRPQKFYLTSLCHSLVPIAIEFGFLKSFF
jgi:hypothetical protein